MKMVSVAKSFVFILTLVTLPQIANAAIAVDRTRVIFDGGQQATSVSISNQNKELPYLAQAWMEDAQGNKLSGGPLLVLPPVQRIEPGAKSLIKIQAIPSANALLPQDRESIFYFNVREIPPRSNKPNVLQLALQTRIKLFYRPHSIVPDDTQLASPWQKGLMLQREGNGYKVVNPTPYYITITDAEPTGNSTLNSSFKPMMVPPKGTTELGLDAAGLGNKPVLTYINDYGGRPQLEMSCNGSTCVVVNVKAK